MAESARIKITWTTSSSAASYKIYRSDNSNGPWVLKGTVAGYIGTWYDNTVDPSPFKNYYYQIVTTCTNGSTSIENISVKCQNCPTENNTNIFGLRDTVYDTVTTPFGPSPATVQVQYWDGLNDYLNNNYNANKTVLQTASARKLAPNSTPFTEERSLFCHKCGKNITNLTPNTSNPEFSYMSNQKSLISQFPTSPTQFGGSSNDNLGTFIQKKLQSQANLAPTSTTFKMGISSTDNGSNTFVGYNGSYVFLNGLQLSNYNGAAQDFSFAGIPKSDNLGNPLGEYNAFPSIQIGKNANPIGQPQTYTDFSTALELIPSGSTWNDNWYVAFIDTGYLNAQTNPLRCLTYVYQIRRQPNFDYYSGVNLISYGFDLKPKEFNINWTESNILWTTKSSIPYESGDILPYKKGTNYDQNLTFLKFFQIT